MNVSQLDKLCKKETFNNMDATFRVTATQRLRKSRYLFKKGDEVQNKKGQHRILTNFVAVHPTVVRVSIWQMLKYQWTLSYIEQLQWIKTLKVYIYATI